MTQPVRPISTALRKALKDTTLTPGDAAAVALAKTYAAQIDDLPVPAVVEKIGPKLLDALEALGMTPKARAGVLRGRVTFDGATSKLDELRNRRQTRATLIHG